MKTRRRPPAARCIAIPDGRCPRKAAKRNGDLFVCTRHGRIRMAIIDDWLSPQTRRMLLLLDQMVSATCEQQTIARSDYRFSRREVFFVMTALAADRIVWVER